MIEISTSEGFQLLKTSANEVSRIVYWRSEIDFAFVNTYVHGLDWPCANFSGIDLSGCIFEKCNLLNCNFSGSILNNTVFRDCDITYGIFPANSVGYSIECVESQISKDLILSTLVYI